MLVAVWEMTEGGTELAWHVLWLSEGPGSVFFLSHPLLLCFFLSTCAPGAEVSPSLLSSCCSQAIALHLQ